MSGKLTSALLWVVGLLGVALTAVAMVVLRPQPRPLRPSPAAPDHEQERAELLEHRQAWELERAAFESRREALQQVAREPDATARLQLLARLTDGGL